MLFSSRRCCHGDLVVDIIRPLLDEGTELPLALLATSRQKRHCHKSLGRYPSLCPADREGSREQGFAGATRVPSPPAVLHLRLLE